MAKLLVLSRKPIDASTFDAHSFSGATTAADRAKWAQAAVELSMFKTGLV